MNWSDIKDTVGKIAPTAGLLLGGGAGGAVGSLIASALGVDNNAKSVSLALQSPEAASKLAEIELTHAHEFRSLALTEARKTLVAELKDTQNARENHKHSKMPAIIVIMLTVIVAGLLVAIFTSNIPQGHANMAMMMFGWVFALWGSAISYFVGTTRSSADKNKFFNQKG